MAVEIKMAVGFDEWLWSACGKKVANKRSQIVTGGFSEFYHLLRYMLGTIFQWAGAEDLRTKSWFQLMEER